MAVTLGIAVLPFPALPVPYDLSAPLYLLQQAFKSCTSLSLGTLGRITTQKVAH